MFAPSIKGSGIEAAREFFKQEPGPDAKSIEDCFGIWTNLCRHVKDLAILDSEWESLTVFDSDQMYQSSLILRDRNIYFSDRRGACDLLDLAYVFRTHLPAPVQLSVAEALSATLIRGSIGWIAPVDVPHWDSLCQRVFYEYDRYIRSAFMLNKDMESTYVDLQFLHMPDVLLAKWPFVGDGNTRPG
jgi:hypothetical protein